VKEMELCDARCGVNSGWKMAAALDVLYTGKSGWSREDTIFEGPQKWLKTGPLEAEYFE
jgi:hypothetical protein